MPILGEQGLLLPGTCRHPAGLPPDFLPAGKALPLFPMYLHQRRDSLKTTLIAAAIHPPLC